MKILAFLLLAASAAAAPLRPITARDRVLVVAPHPDDESLGAGGLLQRAVAAHARIRVVFLTNGDNNVWAQRYIEHRFYIGAADKARWGARRDKEALNALGRLGVPAKSAVFLDFHDSDTTRLLMTGNQPFQAAIDSSIIAWQPTILVLPSPDDLHPDHNTAYVVTRLEYRRLNTPLPYELEYLVHTNGAPKPGGIELPLTAEEKQTKLEAILRHATQMTLGRKRFTAFASDVETFRPPGLSGDPDPLFEAKLERGILRVAICRQKNHSLHGAVLDVAMQTTQGEPIRLEMPLPPNSQNVQTVDSMTRQPASTAWVRYQSDKIEIAIPVSSPARLAFVKLDWTPVFFDIAGWREAPVSSR